MSRSSVVFPQPDAPTTAVMLPRSSCRSMWSSTTWPLNDFASPSDVDHCFGHSAATFVDWRNSRTVTGMASSTNTIAYGAAAA